MASTLLFHSSLSGHSVESKRNTLRHSVSLASGGCCASPICEKIKFVYSCENRRGDHRRTAPRQEAANGPTEVTTIGN